MKEELKLMLVLRPTKIIENPLDLFSVSDSNLSGGYWFDFEYDPYNDPDNLDKSIDDELVDGYEVNIFESVPQSVSKASDYLPKFIVDKKFLSKSFIGDRNPGDVGLLTMITNKGSIVADSKFSEETTRDFFPSIYAFYTNFKNGNFDINDFKYPLDVDGVDKLMNLLIKTSRDLKINDIL